MVCQSFDRDEEKATNILNLTTKVSIEHCFCGAVGGRGLLKRCHVTVCCCRCGGCYYCQKEAPLVMFFTVRVLEPRRLEETNPQSKLKLRTMEYCRFCEACKAGPFA